MTDVVVIVISIFISSAVVIQAIHNATRIIVASVMVLAKALTHPEKDKL